MKQYAFVLCGLLIAAAAARADDWPQWMGPQRDNVWRETGLLSAFPKAGPKVLWKVKVANGYSLGRFCHWQRGNHGESSSSISKDN